MHVHILGICGTLMGSIALLARQQGHTVTGTDENVYPPMSTQLEEAGISLSEGYRADSVPRDTDLVIVGNANLPRGNPALEDVLNRQVPYTSGAEYLGRYLLQDRWVIAVAGTHGKTTTTSMISWILDQAGLNPGFLIGGVPRNFEQSSRLGSDPFFVIEADEYDTSYFDRRSKFLHYRPRTLVLNNLEYDHADIFEDLDAIKNQFHLLLRSVPGEGLVIHPANDENLKDVISRGCWSEQLQTGTSQFLASALTPDHSELEISISGQVVGKINWSLTGKHNAANALAAMAAARHIGVSPRVACEALSAFESVKRRMEVIHEARDLTIYDDFAHHPTAIRTTLAGLRARVKDARILAVIEPASHTMKKGTHETTLQGSATDADEVIWFRPETINWDMSALETSNSAVIDSVDQLIDEAVGRIRSCKGDLHVVIMSNGSFQGASQRIVANLRQ